MAENTKYPYNTSEDYLCEMTANLRALLYAETARVGTQALLAQLIGVSEATLTNILAGRIPTLETMSKIAYYFRCPIPELLRPETVDEYRSLRERILSQLEDLRKLIEAEFR